MSTVTLKAVHKSYGKDEVLHDINIAIADREFIVVVGPSGCGKSTLLRTVAGLEDVTSGDVLIDDKVVTNLEPMERNIAMVFQNYALYPHMNVFDNMAYSLKIARVSKADIKERVQEAAELLQLSEYLKRKPRQLSGGQRQRVAMGRAIVRKPNVFLFDEPLSNLDAKLRVQMRLEMRKLQKRLGVTSIYVTHDQVEAMTLGDRLMVLNGGTIEQFGTPLELYQTPASLFVAGFIGSPAMNVFEGHAKEGVVTLENNAAVTTPYSITDKVKLGIRPEHLLVDKEGPIQVETDMLEQLGSNTLIHGTLAGTSTGIVVSIPGIHSEDMIEKSFRVKPMPTELHLFNADSGKRLL